MDNYLDSAEAARFIEALTGSADTAVTFQTFTDSADKPRPDPLAAVLHGTLAEHLPELRRRSDQGAGVYVTVNAGGRKAADITAIRAFFVDFDAKDGQHPPDAWAVAPSIVVRSGGGSHAYWIAAPGEALDDFTPTQVQLIRALKSDPIPKDLSRVMRLPGFPHSKDPANPRPVTIELCEPDRRYTAAELWQAYPAVADDDGPADWSVQVDSETVRKVLADVPPGERARRAAAYLAAMGPAVEGDGGDLHTFRAACVGRDFAVDPEDWWPRLLAWNATCEPPWSESELRGKLDGVYLRGYAQRPAGWQLTVGALPPFPVAAMPSDLADYARALAVSTQTPVDMAAILTLAAVAASAQRHYTAAVRPDWREPLGLFVAVALPPGERKSAVFSSVTDPIGMWERDAADRVAPHVVDAETRAEVLSRARDKATRQGKAEDAQDAARRLAMVKVPTAPRVVADDVTPERLATLMDEHGGSIGIMSAEGAGPFALMAGRYSGGAPAFEVYLKGHAGDAVHVDRVKGTSVHLPRPALTVGVAVQPEALDRLADIPNARGLGLLARFLYSLPASRVGYRDVSPPPIPEALREQYHQLVWRILETPPVRPIVEGEDGSVVLHFDRVTDDNRHRLAFDEGAQRGVEATLAEIEPRLLTDLRTIVDWAGKLTGAVVRIAALFAVVEAAAVVTADHVNRARRFIPYLIAHARAAFDRMQRSSVQRAQANPVAAAVLAVVNEAGGELTATATELLALLSKLAPDGLPVSAVGIGKWLDGNLADLKTLRVRMRKDRRRRYTLTVTGVTGANTTRVA